MQPTGEQTQKSVDEILAEFDLFANDQREHMLEAFDVARRTCPVVHTKADGGYYVVTRYEDVRTVCTNPEIFSSVQPGVRGVPVRLPPLDADPPLHRDFRQLLNPYFSRASLLPYVDTMRDIAKDAIATFIDKGTVEFVHEFSVPFSAGSLASIVFVDQDEDLFQRGIAAVHRCGSEGTPDTFVAVAVLAAEAMAAVAAAPEGREDVLAELINARIDGGRPLTDEERLGIVTVLLLGGLDTTRGMIVNIGYHLATRPEVEPILRKPDWWRSEMDEFIRFEPTVGFMARTVTEPFTLGGIDLEPGDRLAIDFTSANRDAGRFDRPDELHFDRESNIHAGFGLGPHRCLGLNFARLQIQIAFEELLAVATNFRVEEEPYRQAGVTFNSPTELHVRFDRL